MPIPPIIIPPHLLLPNPATLAAVRAAAAGAAAPGASSILAYVLAQKLYKQAPDWIREDESWQAFSRSKNATDGNNSSGEDQDGFVDEMASLTAVIQKLEGLLVTGYDKLGSERRRRRRRNVVRRIIRSQRSKSEKNKDLPSQNIDASTASIVENNATSIASELRTQNHSLDSLIIEEDEEDTTPISTLEWHAALLAYWQLCNQMRERYPSLRDDLYRFPNENVDETQEQTQVCNIQEECGSGILTDDNGDFKANAKINEMEKHGSIEDCSRPIEGEIIHSDISDPADEQAGIQIDNSKNESNSDCEPSADDDSKEHGYIEDYSKAIDSEMIDEQTTESISREVSGHCNESKSDTPPPQETCQHYPDSVQPPSSTKDDPQPTKKETPIMSLSELKELQTMLTYAVWAYEPNEELLRSLLLTGKEPASKNGDESEQQTHTADGYQLIVHRTTNYIDPNEDTATSSSLKKSSTKKAKRKPPGRVGYFVAISQSQKTLLIGLKGTSTLEELLTDCCGRAVRVDLDNDPHNHDDANGDIVCREPEHEEALTDNNSREESDILVSACSAQFGNDELVDSASSEDNYFQKSDATESEMSETDPCNNNNLVDMVHVTGGSVEVELAPERKVQDLNHIDDVIEPSSNKSSPPSKQKKTPLSKVPSNNVLLLSSLSTSVPQTQTEVAQPYTIEQSPTEEFMERNGIEMEVNRSHKLRGAHEGILHCAEQLLFEISPLIEEYAVSKGFDVVCTGHSLGAGAASLLAVLIRGKYPELTERQTSSLHGERVRAYAFAPPPVLDRWTALACRHYITSIVNNSDIIPRSSLSNLDGFLTILEAVRNRLIDLGMNPAGSQKSSKPKRNAISSTIALFSKLSEGTNGDLLLDSTELQTIWEEAMSEAALGDGEDDTFYWDEEFGHHLFVPGKLLLMYEAWSKFDSGTAPLAFNAAWTDGTFSALKGFEVAAGGGMATDHLTTSYERALGLIEQTLCA